MILVLMLIAASLHGAGPALEPTAFEEALTEIQINRNPGMALLLYHDIHDPRDQEKILNELTKLAPGDFDDDDLQTLKGHIEKYHKENKPRTIELSMVWKQTLKLGLPTKTVRIDLRLKAQPWEHAGVVHVEFPRAYATDPEVSGFLASKFRASPTILYAVVEGIDPEIFKALMQTLRLIGDAIQTVPQNLTPKERLSSIATQATDKLTPDQKKFIDGHIYDMIKAAHKLQSQPAIIIYHMRLLRHKIPDEAIKKSLPSELWPGWVKKG